MSIHSHFGFSETEFNTAKPEIFESIPWLTYGITMRDTRPGTDPLSGNVSSSDGVLSGAKNLEIADYDLAREKKRAQARRQALLSRLALRDIAAPLPAHGVEAVEANSKTLPRLNYLSNIPNKIEADAVHSSTDGVGLAFNPADCPITILADTKGQRIAAIHCGYKGLARDIVAKTLSELSLNSKETLVYITQHAHNLSIPRPEMVDLLNKSPVTRYHLSEDANSPILNMKQVIYEQLEKFHYLDNHIQTSEVDTLTDPRFFSHRNGAAGKDVNGRCAVVAGKKLG